MALRIVISDLSFAGGAEVVDSVVSAADLTAYLSSQTVVRPLALTLQNDPQEDPTTVLVSELVLQQAEPGGEVLHRMYQGAGISLSTLIGCFTRSAARSGAITPLQFTCEKGMKLTFTVTDKASAAYDGAIEWDLCSDCGGGAAEAEGEMAG